MPNSFSVTAGATAAVSAPPEAPSEASADHYVSPAFFLQYNLILFAGALLFALAFASFVPLAVGFTSELLWLALAPRSPAFRRWIDHLDVQRRLTRLEQEISAALAPLDSAYRTRHLALCQQHTEIARLLSQQLGVQGRELDTAREKLGELGAAFVRFSAIHDRLSRFVGEVPSQDIEQEILRIREQLATEKDLSVRVSIRQSLALAERRLAQFEQIGNARRAVEVQLDTLEKSIAYVRSRALSLASSGEVLHDIDLVLTQMRSIPALEAETQEAARIL